jgi:Putative Actinobacterial Holin-X, holin superfamily III
MPHQGDSLTVLVKETVDGLGHLMAEHVRLSKLELLENLNVMIRQTARVAVVTGFAFVGYVFLCAGVVFALEPALGLANGAFLVGGTHLAGGVIGLALALTKLARTRVMDGTAVEVHRTVTALSAASRSRELSRGH